MEKDGVKERVKEKCEVNIGTIQKTITGCSLSQRQVKTKLREKRNNKSYSLTIIDGSSNALDKRRQKLDENSGSSLKEGKSII